MIESAEDMSTRVEPIMTIEDLDAMPDDGNRYEIIEGELIVSRSPSLAHQSVSGNFYFMIRDFLANNPIGKLWAAPGVILSQIDGVIPDLVFVSSGRLAEVASGDRIVGAPDLVIEIVSPGIENERRDRIAKRQTYGKFGVREYWVADYQKRTIEVYETDGTSLKLEATLGEQGELISRVMPGFRCAVSAVFAS